MIESAMRRRRFLQTSLAATACLAGRLPLFAGSIDAAARVPFCFSLYGMRSLKLSEALAACASIGYDGVELDCNAGEAGDPARLSAADRRDVRKQLAEHNLALPGLMDNLTLVTEPPKHRANLDRLKALGELGHALSPDKPPVIETVLGGRPAMWDELKDRMATALEDWARAGEAAETVIAIKAHVGGALHTPQDAGWLLDRVDNRWIRLNYDFSHFQLYGFDLKESLELLLDRTVFIHVKDTQGKAGDFRFLLPGEGDIDYAAYFKLLKEHNYQGALCVEVSGQIHKQPDYEPLAAAKRSYENLAPNLDRADVRGARAQRRSSGD